MRKAERNGSGWEPGALLLALLLSVILITLASSCSPRIVEHIRYQHDTTYVVKRDSVRFYDRDSIYIREKGDTVYKYVEKWRWRDRVRVDTFYRTRVDSVFVEHTKIVEVEKPLSWWRKWQIGAFWWLCGAVVLLLLWTFRKFIFKIF